MVRYGVKRLGQSALSLALAITGVFFLIRLAPGDPVSSLANDDATPQELAALRAQYGLDDSLWVQYRQFVWEAAHGNLGTSFSHHRSALAVILERLPYTMLLALVAILLTAAVAIPLGIATARRANGKADGAVNVLAIGAQSMPDFWLGLMLIFVFASTLHLFPTSGYASTSAIVLPAATIAILQTAVILRVTRREVARAQASPFVLAGRSRGLSERRLLWAHTVRNAAIPVVTVLGTRFAGMLNGVVIVEVVFAWPGVGSTIIRALQTRDYPLIIAAVLVTSVLTVLVNLMVDLLYPLVDPRVRLGAVAR